MILRLLLARLFAFFALGVDDPEGGADDDAGGGDAGGESTGDDTLDGLLNLAEPDAGSPAPDDVEEPDPKAASAASRRRAEAAENLLAQERAARQAAEARAAPPQRFVDPDYEREEAEIAQAKAGGANAEQLSWLNWKVDSNRRMRASQQASFGALAQAQDLQDRMAFERLEVTKPAVFKKYAPRVEAAMNEMRARGQNAPRLAVLRLLLGDDIMSGAFKPKKAASTAATVDRGRNVSARGNVSGSARLTEHQKRTQRLEGKII